MEDALALFKYPDGPRESVVLILVLMEDALARWQFFENLGRTYCLNPCFNGRCTRTVMNIFSNLKIYAGLNPCFNGRCTRTWTDFYPSLK